MASFTTLSARRAGCKQKSCAFARARAQDTQPRAFVSARAQGTQPDIDAKIYLGKGRFIDDDPSKYPAKDEWGTGGWAGGEKGAPRCPRPLRGHTVS